MYKVKNNEPHMSWDRKISLVTSIISFVAVLVAFLTLSEMAYEREVSFAPNLVIENKLFNFRGDTSEIIQNQIFSSIENIDDSYREDINLNFDMRIRFKNIGLGTAKNITIKWDNNDLDNYIDIINSYNNDLYKIIVQDGFVYLRFCGDNIQTGIANDQNIKYLLPIYNDTSDCYFSFPLYYPYIFSMILCLVSENADIPVDINFPDIKGVLTYSDIQEKTYQERFILKPNLILFSLSPDGTYTATIEITQTE